MKHLAGYGALGVITVLALLFARYKDRETKAAQTTIRDLHNSYQGKIEEADTEHRREMQVLLERYISKSETWMEKYHEHARELRVLVSALREHRREG